MEESLFWAGVAAVMAALAFAVFSFGVLVGYKFAFGMKHMKTAGLTNEQEALVKYFHAATEVYCSKKSPGAFHLQPICAGVDMKPIQFCSHCLLKLKKQQ